MSLKLKRHNLNDGANTPVVEVIDDMEYACDVCTESPETGILIYETSTLDHSLRSDALALNHLPIALCGRCLSTFISHLMLAQADLEAGTYTPKRDRVIVEPHHCTPEKEDEDDPTG